MLKRKFWFTGIAAVFFLALSGLNTVRADVPSWFWNALFTWAASVTDEVDALEAQVVALEAQVTALQTYLKVDTSDPSKPVVRIVGANLQVVNGLGSTSTKNGVGNLIVGYDEDADPFSTEFCSDGIYEDSSSCLSADETWAVNQKSGSHYIVGGTKNSYTQFGGLVVGTRNVSNGIGASVSGGSSNIASGAVSNVSGGTNNTASGTLSSVSGGYDGIASGERSSVSGGQFNAASGYGSSVSGGLQNAASGDGSSVSGGGYNTASGWGYSSVSGGSGNTASGLWSSVSGGENRDAAGEFDWAAGSLWEDD